MKEMKVVILEPMKRARSEIIDGSLNGLQSVVGGMIEAVYAFDDAAAIICCESGKIDGLALNRALRTPDGLLYDIIAGTALIAGLGMDDFTSLTDDQLNYYLHVFEYPEIFYRYGPTMVAFPLVDVNVES